MKFYPNADIFFYVEQDSPWIRCIRYDRKHSWKLNDKTTSRVIRYWRDLEGSKKDVIKTADLYMNTGPKSRIRAEACLPLLYATGYRYIKLTMAGPAGFKCAPAPVNLDMARKIKVKLAKEKKAATKAAKKAKKDKKNAKKNEKKGKGKIIKL